MTYSVYHPWLLHKITSQSVRNFLSNGANKRTNKQTNPIKNIISLAGSYIWLVRCYTLFQLQVLRLHFVCKVWEYSWVRDVTWRLLPASLKYSNTCKYSNLCLVDLDMVLASFLSTSQIQVSVCIKIFTHLCIWKLCQHDLVSFLLVLEQFFIPNV